jgi:hypothetical protein
MNLQVIRWLIAHRELVIKVLESAKKFDRDGDYMSQWTVIDEIARLVIPVLQKEDLSPYSLLNGWYDDDEVQAFSLGAEVQAMGFDWKQLIDVILPILIAILKSLASDE